MQEPDTLIEDRGYLEAKLIGTNETVLVLLKIKAQLDLTVTPLLSAIG